jgi:SpoVK/Ycf46/Vps4 family AAA+-type ATPase
MVISRAVEQRLERVLREQRNHEALTGHGLEPRRKLLLVGPPGTGKTLTASVLATELRLPLFVARFDSLITKFMGESASKLRVVFEALKSTRGVYLFDEFDSLGLQRGSQHDVAEMRRTLNMFLQLIEQDTSESLIVATAVVCHANMIEMLVKLYFSYFPQLHRIKVTDKEDEARTWLDAQLAQHALTGS